MNEAKGQPRIGSLFAGIGGFDLGFQRAGFASAFVCEIDPAAQGVLRHRFPESQLFADVCAIGAHNLPAVDVVTFGSPCQDLSVAGKRAGLAGERSGLFFQAVRVIRELRERHGKPDFAVWENVPGAFSSNGGADFSAVIEALADIGAMDIAWRVLDSQNFGVAQRRRRVFLVVDFAGERAHQILFESEGLRGNHPKGGPKRKGASADSSRGAGNSGPEWPATVGGKLTASMGDKWGLDDQHALGGAPLFVPVWRGSDQANAETLEDKAGTLNRNAGQNGGILFHQPDPSAIVNVRRLTPVECERLQGFPDGWTSGGVDEAGRLRAQSDAPRYKQLGNAVTVNVAEWIGRRMAAVRGGGGGAPVVNTEPATPAWDTLPEPVVEDHELAGLDAGEQSALFMAKRLDQVRPLLEDTTAERDRLKEQLAMAREGLEAITVERDVVVTRAEKYRAERDALQLELDKFRAERHDAEPLEAELASAKAQLEWLETMLESTRVEHDRRMETMKARVACLRAILQVVRGRGEA